MKRAIVIKKYINFSLPLFFIQIMIDFQEENCPFQDTFFIDLFKRYLNEVSPNTKIVLVSFIEGSDPGAMASEIIDEGYITFTTIIQSYIYI